MFKTKTLHLKIKTFCDVYYRLTEKQFSISAINESTNENEIPFTAINKNENAHSFYKNENESYLIILLCFFSYIYHQVSHSMCRQYLVQFCLFLQVVLVDGIPLSSCKPTVYHLCGIFLDDISTREQFAFLVYCYRMKAIFHNLCTVLLLASVWPNT